MDSNASVSVTYTSPNMTIQYCVEVCRGANKPIAALIVIKFNKAFNTMDNSIKIDILNLHKKTLSVSGKSSLEVK